MLISWLSSVVIVAEIVWKTLSKLMKLRDSRRAQWKGTIDELVESGVYEDKVWNYPVRVEGTFSEYVPFVNFSAILPELEKKTEPLGIGTCRLGDSIEGGKYIGALYLPNETTAFGTPAVPIFFDEKVPLSRTIGTGVQVSLLCRVKELNRSWKKIFSPAKSFVFERDDRLVPFGLEVQEVESSHERVDKFLIDAWALYHFDTLGQKLPHEVEELVSSVFKDETEKDTVYYEWNSLKDLYCSDKTYVTFPYQTRFALKYEKPEEIKREIRAVVTKYLKAHGVKTTEHEISSSYYPPPSIFKAEKGLFYTSGILDVLNKEVLKMERRGKDIVDYIDELKFLQEALPELKDSIGKETVKRGQKTLDILLNSTYLDFQFDQVNPVTRQSINLQSIVKEFK